jgi:hypothetical protein
MSPADSGSSREKKAKTRIDFRAAAAAEGRRAQRVLEASRIPGHHRLTMERPVEAGWQEIQGPAKKGLALE